MPEDYPSCVQTRSGHEAQNQCNGSRDAPARIGHRFIVGCRVLVTASLRLLVCKADPMCAGGRPDREQCDMMRESRQSGPVAQLGARFHGMEEVKGSNPFRSTKTFPNTSKAYALLGCLHSSTMLSVKVPNEVHTRSRPWPSVGIQRVAFADGTAVSYGHGDERYAGPRIQLGEAIGAGPRARRSTASHRRTCRDFE